MERLNKTRKVFVLALVVIAVLLSSACGSQEPTTPTTTPTTPTTTTPQAPVEVIKLRWASYQPPTAVDSIGHEAWMQKIENDTNDRVQFNRFWAGSLLSVGDMNDGLNSGAAEIGSFLPSMSKPSIWYFDGGTFMIRITDGDIQRRIYKEVAVKFPEVTAEYGNLKYLAYKGASVQIFLLRDPITSLDDLKGKAIGAPATWGSILKKFGPETANTRSTEVYLQLSKSMIQGMVFPLSSVKEFALAEVTKYAIEWPFVHPTYPDIAMGMKAWDRLPPDIQKIFEDNIEFASKLLNEGRNKGNADGEAYLKQSGVQYIELSQVEKDRLIQAGTDLEDEIAAKIDGQGQPGTKVLEEIRRLVK